MDEKERESIEILNRIDKRLKNGTKKALKRGLLSVAPLLALILIPIIPKAFIPMLLGISSISSLGLAIKSRKEDEVDEIVQERELEKDLKRLEKTFPKGRGREIFGPKNVMSNELFCCLDIEYFEEFANSYFQYLDESNKVDNPTIKEDAVNQFLNPIYNILGNDVKIISTLDSMGDIIINMQGRTVNKRAATYLYDGSKFYVYIPNKEAVVMLPITHEIMYNIFLSNEKNLRTESLVQFFTEVYGPLDYDDDFNKRR